MGQALVEGGREGGSKGLCGSDGGGKEGGGGDSCYRKVLTVKEEDA